MMAIRRRSSGFVLLLMVVSMGVLLGAIGLALDLGRLYLIRSEAQTFADMAALSAARELDGSHAGVDRAREVVAHSPQRWDFGVKTFPGVGIEFSPDSKAWRPIPALPGDVHFVRVTAETGPVDLLFLPFVVGRQATVVRARAVARKDTEPAAAEMLPFAPAAKNPDDANFGFRIGERISLGHSIEDVEPSVGRSVVFRETASQLPANGPRERMVPVIDGRYARVIGFASIRIPAGSNTPEADYLGPASSKVDVRLFQ
jgi:Putative Flp pilus-assembly TadE/G-like